MHMKEKSNELHVTFCSLVKRRLELIVMTFTMVVKVVYRTRIAAISLTMKGILVSRR